MRAGRWPLGSAESLVPWGGIDRMMDAGDAALSHPRATIVVRRVINLAKRLQHSLTVQARQDRARGGGHL